MINPYYFQNMLRSPEQYQAELYSKMQPQMEQYAALYNSVQRNANAGTYVKVQSYDEVRQIQAPADGKPVMIFDEKNGRLYSKRFENGNAYIVGFTLVPLEEKKGQGSSDVSKVLENIEKRLEALERRESDGNAGLPDEHAEKAQPAGL